MLSVPSRSRRARPTSRGGGARTAAAVLLAVLLAVGAFVTGAATGTARAGAGPVVGHARTSAYWLVASDGGIFSFGGAGFYGSTGGMRLNQPIVGMAGTADSQGYWLVAGDGGIFAYGDAGFYGSTGNLVLNQPIVGMTATHSGRGYWFTADDGGVFAFGDAGFYGSLGGVPVSRPVVAITATPDGGGYWFTDTNGLVTPFGDATYWGSAPQVLNDPVVGMAEAAGNGNFTGSPYPSGTYGYDISNFQCPGQQGYPPQPHTIGIVQVVGASFASTNPCLAGEAAWAGGGLNLYVFLTYGNAASSGDPACQTAADPSTCNYGFGAAQDAFAKAQAAGVNTSVAWWLDVESYSIPGVAPWSASTASNASLIQGAIAGLHAEGINSVGIYASPGVWNGIVGSYRPAAPYWAASWGVNPATTCSSVAQQFPNAILPNGPVQIVQYSSPSTPLPIGLQDTAFDNDYAC
jgi:hypothetical protein